jgi:hypothetical protein
VGGDLGGGVGVITAGYVGDVFVGLVPGRYDQRAQKIYLALPKSLDSLLSFIDLLHRRKY